MINGFPLCVYWFLILANNSDKVITSICIVFSLIFPTAVSSISVTYVNNFSALSYESFTKVNISSLES